VFAVNQPDLSSLVGRPYEQASQILVGRRTGRNYSLGKKDEGSRQLQKERGRVRKKG
jgi:hypothetical protein